MEYICETCDFKTSLKTNLARHNQTKKHLKLCGECVMEVPVIPAVSELELIKARHELEMAQMKFNYELKLKDMELRMKDIIIQCEKEKNEYFTNKTNIRQPSDEHRAKLQEVNKEYTKQAAPAVAFYETMEALRSRSPSPEPVAEAPRKIKFELLQPEVKPAPETKTEPSSPKSPKNNKKVKCIKGFLGQKCAIGGNTTDDFLEKIKNKITNMDVSLVIAKRKDKNEYVWNLIREVYDSFDKYNKPFYSDDKYHKQCYLVDGKEWAKESICGEKDRDVVSGGMIYNLLTEINSLLLEKAEAMGKIYRFTDEMFDEWCESHGDEGGSPPLVGSFGKTSEFKAIDILESTNYDLDHNSFVYENTERLLDIIYITKEEMNE